MMRGGVTGAPVTELEYKLYLRKAVLDEANYGDVLANLGWYHENTISSLRLLF
ncbi:hypothetical protein DFQ01_10698 [Paenibacillus cellulosilyticus]|uniref:Uncharacterized protein n=1 Tax=Paenibacillus cellulosilyticus TaxID=375489 RepID=A0A2V2YUP1_9BACL|nr:hypothetical protein DFQ01_10698 [Paenibacillus cellulosilyticus]